MSGNGNNEQISFQLTKILLNYYFMKGKILVQKLYCYCGLWQSSWEKHVMGQRATIDLTVFYVIHVLKQYLCTTVKYA